MGIWGGTKSTLFTDLASRLQPVMHNYMIRPQRNHSTAETLVIGRLQKNKIKNHGSFKDL